MDIPNKEGSMGAGSDDLYSDGADPSNQGDDDSKPADKDPDQQDDATEAVLPKTLMSGKNFNVGDDIVLTITGIHDEQFSVKYSTAKSDESGDDGGDDKASMPPAMAGGGDSDYDDASAMPTGRAGAAGEMF